jgi:hypothetical protein
MLPDVLPVPATVGNITNGRRTLVGEDFQTGGVFHPKPADLVRGLAGVPRSERHSHANGHRIWRPNTRDRQQTGNSNGNIARVR